MKDSTAPFRPGHGVLDFRGRLPPEPLMGTLAAIDAWVDATPLTVVYDRQPYLLFPELDTRGLRYEVDTRPDGVYVRIFVSSGQP
jgi:hypothetical protein